MRFSDLPNPKAAMELIKRFKRTFSAKTCLSPFRDCEGSIIAAHTISKQAMLRPVSRNGQVYVPEPPDLFNPEKGRPTELMLKGIGETSVFYGFCGKHDKLLFMPIEDEPFYCRPNQLFLHAYRAVAKESYLKVKQAASFPTVEDIRAVHGIPEETVMQFSVLAELFQVGSKRGAEEIEQFKSRMDSHLLASEWLRVKTTIVPLKKQPTIVCNFSYAPDFDFAGKYLQDFENFQNNLSPLMVTILPDAKDGGFVLLSHFDDANPAPRNMIKSLLAQDDFTSSLIWMVICYAENFAASPQWYESLPESERRTINYEFHANADVFADDSKVGTITRRKFEAASWEPQTEFTI